MRKNIFGFTLVEILIVVGVIGIILSLVLPNLLGVRSKTKDDQRIADLKNVSLTLELFKLKCGFYPGKVLKDSFGNPECRGASSDSSEAPVNAFNPSRFQDLIDFLKEAEIGSGKILNDPDISLGESYDYYIQTGSGSSIPRGQCYILRARLSGSSKLPNDDIDNADIISKLAPVSCSSESCKNLYPGGIDCDGDYYCMGNKECFYGN